MKEKIKSYIYVARFEELIFGYIIKWILITAVVGALTGSASALLLFSLNWATDYRENHLWIISLLPTGRIGNWLNVPLFSRHSC